MSGRNTDYGGFSICKSSQLGFIQLTQSQPVCHYSAVFEIKMFGIAKTGKSKVVIIANGDDDDHDDDNGSEQEESTMAISWLKKWSEISQAINATAAELDHANILLAGASDERQKAQDNYSQAQNIIDAEYQSIINDSVVEQMVRDV